MPTTSLPVWSEGGGVRGPVILKVIVIRPPGRHVHRLGGLIFPSQAMAPSLAKHLPIDVPRTAVTLHPGPGTHAKLSMKPTRLWFWTTSMYTPDLIVRSDRLTSAETFADWSGSSGSAPLAVPAPTNATVSSTHTAAVVMRGVTSSPYPLMISAVPR